MTVDVEYIFPARRDLYPHKEEHVKLTKKEWYRRRQMYVDLMYKKSRLPAIGIEPLPMERQRLPFKMTAEDRALRQQWLKDHILSPNEPRHVPELAPRNFVRRWLGYPWDAATKVVGNAMVRE